MQLTANINSIDLPERFGKATRRIILHAGVYGPFAASRPHRNGLAKALNKDSFKRLDIIGLTEGCPQPWQTQFMDALRFDASDHEKAKVVLASDDFLEKLQIACPAKVVIHPLRTLPLMPVIIIDDTIIFGQYAHCSQYAATGFWGVIETDVDKLLEWAEEDTIPAFATDEEVAAYRLVYESLHAMGCREAACVS